MVDMVKREVAGPAKDWLSRAEVCELIEASDSSLAGLIGAGQFPRGIPFPCGEYRWRWVDVVWWLLGREVAARLADPPAAAPGAKGHS